jgi:hypothetical protein
MNQHAPPCWARCLSTALLQCTHSEHVPTSSRKPRLPPQHHAVHMPFAIAADMPPQSCQPMTTAHACAMHAQQSSAVISATQCLAHAIHTCTRHATARSGHTLNRDRTGTTEVTEERGGVGDDGDGVEVLVVGPGTAVAQPPRPPNGAAAAGRCSRSTANWWPASEWPTQGRPPLAGRCSSCCSSLTIAHTATSGVRKGAQVSQRWGAFRLIRTCTRWVSTTCFHAGGQPQPHTIRFSSLSPQAPHRQGTAGRGGRRERGCWWWW